MIKSIGKNVAQHAILITLLKGKAMSLSSHSILYTPHYGDFSYLICLLKALLIYLFINEIQLFKIYFKRI